VCWALRRASPSCKTLVACSFVLEASLISTNSLRMRTYVNSSLVLTLSLSSFGCAGTTPPAATAADEAPKQPAQQQAVAPEPEPLPATTPDTKSATSYTLQHNQHVLQTLPFSDRADFENAEKGFLGTWDEPSIKDAQGRVVWDFQAWSFLKGEAPSEVNPSLWRMAKLNALHGLFKVSDAIYQVRGFDLSVMSIIEGNNGVIVVDPLLTKETAAAGLKVYRKYRGDKPVVAVIYTHSHVDHFGGVRGVVDEEDVKAGNIKIIAPEGFMEHAVSENVFAGNAMSRRATYMYGSMLPKGARGSVDAGLGKTTSTGEVTLIQPTDTVTKTGQRMRVAGVELVFLMAPGSEAPSEMLFFIPSMKALCMAEDVTHTHHNLYTLRGAQVRDPHAWSGYLQEMLNMWGPQVEVGFASHHWPTWGNKQVTDLISSQRDLYKYMNDQTLNLANKGLTMTEIAEELTLPPSLANNWANRDYYGTVSHNAKAVYQRYLGWFDGNPSHLQPLAPAEASVKYIDYMGGAAAVMRKVKATIDAGEYRWAAQVLDHVVFADPQNTQAKLMLADVLEQLGYQAESGPWRGFYLTGAMELRKGVRQLPAPDTAAPDVVASMTPEMFLDYLAVRVDATKAAGKNVTVALAMTDGKKTKDYTLTLKNSVLNFVEGKARTPADAVLTLDWPTFVAISNAKITVADAITKNKVTVEGDSQKLDGFLQSFDTFDFWFPIVTP
jgi:alkyl sulfatase BDS1-like metallo-beta-lactamase superfamily hydrolase